MLSLLQLSRFCTWNGKWVPPVWHWNAKSVSAAQSSHPHLHGRCSQRCHTHAPALLPAGTATLGPSAGSSLCQCSISCSTLAILWSGGAFLKARGPSPSSLRPAPAALPRAGSPLNKEAASPTSGLVRS